MYKSDIGCHNIVGIGTSSNKLNPSGKLNYN